MATLWLSNNKIGDEGAKAIAEAIRASGSLALKTLYVGFSHAGLKPACKEKGVTLF